MREETKARILERFPAGTAIHALLTYGEPIPYKMGYDYSNRIPHAHEIADEGPSLHSAPSLLTKLKAAPRAVSAQRKTY